MQNCCCGMNRLYVKVKERLGGSPNHHGTSPGPSIRKISGPRSQSVERHYSPAAIESESIERNGDYLSGGLTKFPISAPGTPRTPRLGGLHPNYASKRKPEVAVAPQISGGRRYSGHRDSDQHVHGSPYNRRNSSSQGLDLPAYNSVMSRMTGDERIVDGPSLGTPTSSNSSTIAEQLRVSMLEQKVNELQAQLSQIRPQPQLQQSYGQNSRDLYEMEDELLKTKDQYKQLQQSYRKITKQNDAMQQEYEHTIQQLTNELDRAKLDLEEFQQKQYEMEEKLAMVQEKSSTPGAVDQMKTRELQAKTEQIRQLQIELTNHRTDLAALELMKKDYDKLKGEFEYQKSKLDELQRANDDKDDRIRDLQRTLNAQRLDLQAAACQQSCSSGSTPVADDAESLADVMARSMYAAIPSQTRNSRTVTPRTYTKAHTTLGGMESPTLSNKRSTSGSRNRLPLMPSVLTKSYSNFNLNSTGGGPISEITPQMSQAIRSQEKKLLDSQLLVRSLLGTLQKVANGEQPDISRLLGIKTESMSESETEQVEPDSSPLTITAAEKKVRFCYLYLDTNHTLYLLNNNAYCEIFKHPQRVLDFNLFYDLSLDFMFSLIINNLEIGHTFQRCIF
ncbi:hypothetical protein WR25_00624 isoform B [Diploscapter pachys]|uniref:Uncharacterized protein n=1 Tax=Diploscapter pachys TaxID=2018661 RepID=A0A2A2JU34_9BILA|nr:hypothetical protein WR25_00624 isoform B [Diploscapter pachys]